MRDDTGDTGAQETSEGRYNRDTRDEPLAESEQLSGEAVSQGRDVRDTTREGEEHGVDVLSDENPAEIEDTGRTVVDRSRRVETRGVDVIDLGPASEPLDEPPDASRQS